jgi:hypothetical protein
VDREEAIAKVTKKKLKIEELEHALSEIAHAPVKEELKQREDEV